MAIELQQSCIDACLASARACEQCQHACLEEADISKYEKPSVSPVIAPMSVSCSRGSWRGKAITGGKRA